MGPLFMTVHSAEYAVCKQEMARKERESVCVCASISLTLLVRLISAISLPTLLSLCVCTFVGRTRQATSEA